MKWIGALCAGAVFAIIPMRAMQLDPQLIEDKLKEQSNEPLQSFLCGVVGVVQNPTSFRDELTKESYGFESTFLKPFLYKSNENERAAACEKLVEDEALDAIYGIISRGNELLGEEKRDVAARNIRQEAFIRASQGYMSTHLGGVDPKNMPQQQLKDERYFEHMARVLFVLHLEHERKIKAVANKPSKDTQ